jgi:hypothetical protein
MISPPMRRPLALAGRVLRKPLLHGLGALMAPGVISGAIFYHLFTPPGRPPVRSFR